MGAYSAAAEARIYGRAPKERLNNIPTTSALDGKYSKRRPYTQELTITKFNSK